MKSRWLPLILTFLMLAPTVLPTTGATHLSPNDAEPPQQPTLPEEPLTTTGIIPIDRTLDEVANASRQTNDFVDPFWRDASETFNETAEQLPEEGTITLYKDSIAQREGAFGDWAVLGPPSWEALSDAGFLNTTGYTMATELGGKYAGEARSLLLTPELDLKTGFFDPTVATVQKTVQPLGLLPQQDLRLSTIYQTALTSLEWGVNRECYLALTGDCVIDRPFSEPQDVGSRDGAYLLEYARRYHLASSRDGVQVMVFTERPTGVVASDVCDPPRQFQANPNGLVQDLEDPAPTCTIVQPLQRFQEPNEPDAQEKGLAYTGFDGWANHTIDLTPWAERSVWVGFYFASMPIFTENYFTNDAWFVPGAGFYGFGLDNLRLTAPAPARNLRVRPLTEPSFVPTSAGRVIPTLSMGETIPVHADVLNTGTTPQDVEIYTRLIKLTLDGVQTLLREQVTPPIRMPPGAVHHHATTFAGFNEKLHLCVEVEARVEGAPPINREGFCTQPQPQATNLGDQDEDADPADDLAFLEMDIENITLVQAGRITRGAATARLDDTIPFSMSLSNLGNVNYTVTVRADVIDLGTNPPAPADGFLTHVDGQTVRQVQIRAGTTEILTWSVKAAKEGQYKLFVRVDDAVPFSPEELLPDLLRPYESAWTHTAPTPDGIISAGEWGLAAKVESIVLMDPYGQLRNTPPNYPTCPTQCRELTGTLRAMNDANNLYLALTVQDNTQNAQKDKLHLRFDDLGDRRAASAREDGVTVQGANLVDSHLNATTLAWEADSAPNGTARGAWAANVWTYEVVRPLATHPSLGQDLSVGPGGLVGLLAKAEDWPTSSTAPVKGIYHFPIGATDVDGQSMFAIDASLDDELRGWRLVRLAPSPAAAAPQFHHRGLSPGFGVARSPPAFFEEHLDDCRALATWAQNTIIKAPGSTSASGDPEKWNCGPYGPDGRTRLYEGRSPDAQCAGVPCKPWSGIGKGTIGRAGVLLDTEREARPPNVLITPPIEVDDVDNPYLILRHQYSTEMGLHDSNILNGEGVPEKNIAILTVARVYAEEWNEATRQWENRVLLVPDGGYSTEEKDLIANPAYGISGRTLNPVTKSDKPCAAAGATKNNCGWWWPTGFHADYKPPEETIPVGGTFHGSPWILDRIPLFGSTHGFQQNLAFSASGKTIRLRFEFFSSPGPSDPNLNPPFDFGWRIEGVSVTEGPRFQRDLSLEEVRLDTDLFDAAAIGVGPSTKVPVRLVIRNEGELDVRRLRVNLDGIDVTANSTQDASLCSVHDFEVNEVIQPGQARNLTLDCVLKDRPGALLALRAEAEPVEGDDFPANNQLLTPEVYELRATRDVAVSVVASPRVASDEHVRSLLLTLENRGNVDLSNFTVRRTVLRRDGNEGGTPVSDPAPWRVRGTLPVGARMSLANPLLDLDPPLNSLTDTAFDPDGQSGSFDVVARATLPGDADPGNDFDAVSVVAQDLLFFDDLDRAPVADRAVVNGTRSFSGNVSVWSLQGNGYEGTKRLLAGDATTDEIPPDTDASVVLPDLDLTTVRAATLLVDHRYDLEEQFDAARAEISTDGGTTWRPLSPVPEPEVGLPDGYPSITLLGSTPLTDGSGPTRGVAFTGRSEDLPISDPAGWVTSEFDLSNDPALKRATAVDAFLLTDFPSLPEETPAALPSGDIQFRNPGWSLDEPNAEARQRYWWIQNLTYDSPRPHSGQRMWWSGTAGADEVEDPAEPVRTRLEVPFGVGAIQRPGERTLVTWWSWVAGDADGGTGARFTQTLLDADGAPVNVPVLELASDPTGWRQRAFDVTEHAGEGLALRFDYDSTPVPPLFLDPVKENNLGWFLDDLQLSSFLVDERLGLRHSPRVELTETMESLELDPTTGRAGDWQASLIPGTPAPAPGVRWNLVETGAPARDGGWHVETVEVPGLGPVPAWRFSTANAQGYPHMADSRLVTPVVDLSSVAGDAARLTFDHKYGFESSEVCPLDEALQPTAAERRDQGCFTSAIDGGAVEFQIFDEAKGTFGPWKQLGARFQDFPQRLLLEARTDNCLLTDAHHHKDDLDPAIAACEPAPQSGWASHYRDVDRLFNDASLVPAGQTRNRHQLAATGYSALELRGERGFGDHEPCKFSLAGIAYTPIGHGTSFQSFAGMAKFQFEAGIHNPAPGGCGATGTRDYEQPWRPYDVSYVFSGQSQGVNGWEAVSWDVSPLVGKKVRFGFHSFSNPGYVTGPTGGWSVANVAVQGEVFEGKPVKVRLRLATDSSVTKGEWSLDNLVVVGERFKNNVAVLADSPTNVVAVPGAPVEFVGHVANLGSESRTGLAVAVMATREDDQTAWPVEVLAPQTDPVPSSQLPPGIPAARRWPFLAPGGLPGSEIPIHVRLNLTDDPNVAVSVRVVVLEDHGKPVLANGTLVPRPKYGLADNEVPGNIFAEWTALGVVRQDVQLLPPFADRSGRLVAEPASVQPNQTVALRALVANAGTTQPSLSAVWTLVRVNHKGDPSKQESVGAEDAVAVQTNTSYLAPLLRGQSRPISLNFTPQTAGLYRATLELREGQALVTTTSLEFLVGRNGTYYYVDFGRVAANATGWSDASPPHDLTSGGGSPVAARFRLSDGQYLWGVTKESLSAGQNYCTLGQCNFPSHPDAIQTVKGLEGIANGPLIDLSLVPQGRAVLSLTHGLNLESPGDGARVELIPIKYPIDDRKGPEAVFKCANNQPMAFALVPEPLAAYSERVLSRSGFRAAKNTPGGPVEEFLPNRIHALAPEVSRPATVFGGPVVEHQTTRFPLDLPATSVCRNSGNQFLTRSLINYTVQPRLHLGTTPGVLAQVGPSDPRRGGMGWQIDALRTTSTGIEAAPDVQVLPVLDGAPKRFQFTVRNTGQIEDTIAFGIDANGSTLLDPSWVRFPNATMRLQPGQSRTVPFLVDIPAQPALSRATYTARVVAHSATDPSVSDAIDVDLALRPNPLPDLSVLVSTERYEVEQETVEPLHATVFNVGQVASKPVTVSIVATEVATNKTTPVDKLTIPALCPKRECGDSGSSYSLTFEWQVPPTAGPYIVTATADPEGRLLEERRANNHAPVSVLVVPLRRPDVAVTDLRVDGVGAGSVAEEGSLLTLTANVTNVGYAPAEQVQVRIIYQSAEIKEAILESLQPGETRSVTVVKVASRGEVRLWATAILLEGADLRTENNDFRRSISVRGHDLALKAKPESTRMAPGAVASLTVDVTNRGNGVEKVTLALNETARGWAFLASPNPATVAPNTTLGVLVKLMAPENARAGPSPLTLRAVPAGNPNAAASGTLLVNVDPRAGAPDVAVAGAPVDPGAAVLAVRVASRSNVPENLTLGLAEPAWAHDAVAFTLEPSTNRTLLLPVHVPFNATPGAHAVSVRLKTGTGTFVAGANASLEVRARAQAAAVWVGAPRSLDSPSLGTRAYRFDLRVTNTGNLPIVAMAVPTDLAQHVTAAPPPASPAIGPGQDNIIAVNVSLPPDAPEYLLGRVEIWLRPTLPDDGETPAILATTLDLPSHLDGPDLAVREVQMTPRTGIAAGDRIQITVLVENRGSIEAPGSLLFASVNGELAEAAPIPPLAPGRTAAINLSWTFTDGGEYLLVFSADGDWAVPETQEDNNGVSSPLEVDEAAIGSRIKAVPGPGPAFIAVVLLALMARRAPRRPGGRGRC